MNFEKRFKPEDCVSDDPTRSNINQVFFDRDRSRLVATDGAVMAIVPCVREDEDPTASALINPEALKAARKYAGREPRATLAVTEQGAQSRGGPLFPTPVVTGAYPPYERVVPELKEGEPGVVVIALNPHRLAQLAAAIGVGKEQGVTLTFEVGGVNPKTGEPIFSPVLVDPLAENGARGVLMTMRSKKP